MNKERDRERANKRAASNKKKSFEKFPHLSVKLHKCLIFE